MKNNRYQRAAEYGGGGGPNHMPSSSWSQSQGDGSHSGGARQSANQLNQQKKLFRLNIHRRAEPLHGNSDLEEDQFTDQGYVSGRSGAQTQRLQDRRATGNPQDLKDFKSLSQYGGKNVENRLKIIREKSGVSSKKSDAQSPKLSHAFRKGDDSQPGSRSTRTNKGDSSRGKGTRAQDTTPIQRYVQEYQGKEQLGILKNQIDRMRESHSQRSNSQKSVGMKHSDSSWQKRGGQMKMNHNQTSVEMESFQFEPISDGTPMLAAEQSSRVLDMTSPKFSSTEDGQPYREIVGLKPPIEEHQSTMMKKVEPRNEKFPSFSFQEGSQVQQQEGSHVYQDSQANEASSQDQDKYYNYSPVKTQFEVSPKDLPSKSGRHQAQQVKEYLSSLETQNEQKRDQMANKVKELEIFNNENKYRNPYLSKAAEPKKSYQQNGGISERDRVNEYKGDEGQQDSRLQEMSSDQNDESYHIKDKKKGILNTFKKFNEEKERTEKTKSSHQETIERRKQSSRSPAKFSSNAQLSSQQTLDEDFRYKQNDTGNPYSEKDSISKKNQTGGSDSLSGQYHYAIINKQLGSRDPLVMQSEPEDDHLMSLNVHNSHKDMVRLGGMNKDATESKTSIKMDQYMTSNFGTLNNRHSSDDEMANDEARSPISSKRNQREVRKSVSNKSQNSAKGDRSGQRSSRITTRKGKMQIGQNDMNYFENLKFRMDEIALDVLEKKKESDTRKEKQSQMDQDRKFKKGRKSISGSGSPVGILKNRQNDSGALNKSSSKTKIVSPRGILKNNIHNNDSNSPNTNQDVDSSQRSIRGATALLNSSSGLNSNAMRQQQSPRTVTQVQNNTGTNSSRVNISPQTFSLAKFQNPSPSNRGGQNPRGSNARQTGQTSPSGPVDSSSPPSHDTQQRNVIEIQRQIEDNEQQILRLKREISQKNEQQANKEQEEEQPRQHKREKSQLKQPTRFAGSPKPPVVGRNGPSPRGDGRSIPRPTPAIGRTSPNLQGRGSPNANATGRASPNAHNYGRASPRNNFQIGRTSPRYVPAVGQAIASKPGGLAFGRKVTAPPSTSEPTEVIQTRTTLAQHRHNRSPGADYNFRAQANRSPRGGQWGHGGIKKDSSTSRLHRPEDQAKESLQNLQQKIDHLAVDMLQMKAQKQNQNDNDNQYQNKKYGVGYVQHRPLNIDATKTDHYSAQPKSARVLPSSKQQLYNQLYKGRFNQYNGESSDQQQVVNLNRDGSSDSQKSQVSGGNNDSRTRKINGLLTNYQKKQRKKSSMRKGQKRINQLYEEGKKKLQESNYKEIEAKIDRENKELEECTFNPEIRILASEQTESGQSNRNRKMTPSKSQKFYEKNLNWKAKNEYDTFKMMQEKLVKEASELPFKPQLNNINIQTDMNPFNFNAPPKSEDQVGNFATVGTKIKDQLFMNTYKTSNTDQTDKYMKALNDVQHSHQLEMQAIEKHFQRIRQGYEHRHKKAEATTMRSAHSSLVPSRSQSRSSNRSGISQSRKTTQVPTMSFAKTQEFKKGSFLKQEGELSDTFKQEVSPQRRATAPVSTEGSKYSAERKRDRSSTQKSTTTAKKHRKPFVPYNQTQFQGFSQEPVKKEDHGHQSGGNDLNPFDHSQKLSGKIQPFESADFQRKSRKQKHEISTPVKKKVEKHQDHRTSARDAANSSSSGSPDFGLNRNNRNVHTPIQLASSSEIASNTGGNGTERRSRRARKQQN